MKAFTTLLKTELKLSVRGMDMIIFAICLPVAVMVILGIVYGSGIQLNETPDNLKDETSNNQNENASSESNQ